jgi:hypothetical protein
VTNPPVFVRLDLFRVGDQIDELYKETGTPLRSDLEQYLVDHDANLQNKVDQVIRDLLAGKNVRGQLHKRRTGRPGHPSTRALALAAEHARLVKNGFKARATKLIVAKLKELKMGVDDGALRKEINRAVKEFDASPSQVEKYESKLKALNLI